MSDETTAIIESSLVRIVAILLITVGLQFLSYHMIGRLVRKTVTRAKGDTLVDERKREDTIIVILRTTFSAILWTISVCAILSLLGVNVLALLTGAGLIGVIAGLSVQNTVKDFLAGFFILTEKQYRVGDVITVSGGSTGAVGATGTVEEITLRITKMRNEDGTLTTVRNGEPTVITNKTVSYSGAVMDIAVTYDTDIAALEKIINRLGKQLMKEAKWKDVITKPITFLRVDSFTNDGVVVRAIGTVSPASQWEVGGEFRRRLLAAVAKEPRVKLAHSE